MHLRSVLVPAIAVLALSLSASATPITGQLSFNGYVEAVGSSGIGAATGLEFANASGTSVSGTSGSLTSFGAGTGSFAAVRSCANSVTGCGSIQDIQSFMTSPPILTELSLTGNGTTVSFDLSSITSILRSSDAPGGSITLTANGVLHETGYDNTAGTFTLTAQGNTITAFSATILAAPPTAVTPEPSSLVLLATGLGGVFAAARRRLS